MKKLSFILFGILFLCTADMMAQQQRNFEDNQDKYYSQKIAYITDLMELTPDEAAVFWPLYNENENKKKELQVSFGKYRRDISGRFDELTETEALEAIEVFQNHMKNMNTLTIEYQNKYLDVVSAKKVLLLLRAEKDFRRRMLKKLGNRKRGGI